MARRRRVGALAPSAFGTIASCVGKHTRSDPKAVCDIIEVAGNEAWWAERSQRTPVSMRPKFDRLNRKLLRMADACKAAFEARR